MGFAANHRLGISAIAVAVASLLLTATSTPAQLGTSATMSVRIVVRATCTVTASPLDFGDYDPVTTNATVPLDAQGTLTTACTPNTPMTLELDRGRNASGVTRRMASAAGGEFLRYELYNDAGRTRIWGPAAQSVRFTMPANSVAPVVRTVYGRVPAGQNVAAGDYNDTIEVVLHF